MLNSPEKILRRAFFANLGAIVIAIVILSGLEIGVARAQGLAAGAANAGQQRLTAVNPEPQKVVPIGERQKAATASGQEAQKPAANAMPSLESKAAKKPKGQYYVDFRARTAASYGHAFVWYGRTDQREVEVAGLHPASDNPIPYVIGHVLPVPSETGASYGDLDAQYLTAHYRVYLNEPDAQRVFAYIKRLQASRPLWNAAVYNCVAFVRDIARYMGLKTPLLHTMYPDNWINELRELNGGRTTVKLTSSP
jgi:hypothetical protein